MHTEKNESITNFCQNNSQTYLILVKYQLKLEYVSTCKNRPLETEIASKSRKSKNRPHNAWIRLLGGDFAHVEDHWSNWIQELSGLRQASFRTT